MKILCIFISFIVIGCASHAPIERAAMLNKSLTKQVASLRQFSEYTGVEDEQAQLSEAAAQEKRDISLVRDCLIHRGGYSNPICRADARETKNRTTWIQASAGRGLDDIAHSTKASDRTKHKAQKTLSTIQAKAEQTRLTLDRGGLLVWRYSTASGPPPIPAPKSLLLQESEQRR